MKIAKLSDIHIHGKWIDKIKVALDMAATEIIKQKVSVVVVDGDTFEKATANDKFKKVGALQRVLLDFINKLQRGMVAEIVFILGNETHDGFPNESALEFLKDFTGVRVIETPTTLPYSIDGEKFVIGCLPWINKRTFYGNKCVGLGKTESEQMFTKSILDMLGYFKDKFETDRPTLLFGHAEVSGTKVNKGYTIQSGSYTFNYNALEATEADYISLGHIHKRTGPYCGMLSQRDWRDEGCQQGFEIISIEKGEINEEYIALDLPEFQTIEIKDTGFVIPNNGNDLKLRFHSEEAYNLFSENVPNPVSCWCVEKLWNKQKHVARTETELTVEMTESQLLSEFIKLNPVPEGVTEKQLQEVVA